MPGSVVTSLVYPQPVEAFCTLATNFRGHQAGNPTLVTKQPARRKPDNLRGHTEQSTY